jgi:hypothetical protein
MAAMALLTWFSLLFLVVSVVGSIAFAAVRAWATWRTLRGFSRRAAAAVDEVLANAAAAEEHAARLGSGTARLGTTVARLQESLATLSILQGAFADARASASFRMPRK